MIKPPGSHHSGKTGLIGTLKEGYALPKVIMTLRKPVAGSNPFSVISTTLFATPGTGLPVIAVLLP